MKRICIFFLALILVFSMTGCSAEQDAQTSNPTDRVVSEADTEPTSMTEADELEFSSSADAGDMSEDKNLAGEVGVFDLEKGTVLLNN